MESKSLEKKVGEISLCPEGHELEPFQNVDGHLGRYCVVCETHYFPERDGFD